MACRVGSDPYTWVSQETLAEELDMSLIGLKRLSKKACETNLIESIPNPHDKRKRLYRPAQFLINYTQKRREKLSTEDGFGTFFVPKKVYKSTPNNSRKVYKSIPTRYTKVYLISKKNDDKPIDNQQVKELSTPPKGHETTIINKQPESSRKKRGLICDSFYPNYENQKLADQTASKTGKTGMYLIRRFIEVMKKHNVTSDDFNIDFKKFLERELPYQKITKRDSMMKSINSYL